MNKIALRKHLPRDLGRAFPWLLLIVAAGIYLDSIFSHHPLLQPEMIGIAFFWTQPNLNWLDILFNPQMTDGHAGRFRYLEHLTEGAYWSLVHSGLLPQTLHDYFALAVILSLILVLYVLVKKMSQSKILACLVVLFFLFNMANFVVVLYHFRKAKLLVSLLLVCLIAASHFLKDKRTLQPTLILLGVLGTLTDPYFIVLAPVLCFCVDLHKSPNYWVRTTYLIRGLLLGGGFVIVLNGFIGPQLNSEAKLLLWNLPGIPKNLFSPQTYFISLKF